MNQPEVGTAVERTARPFLKWAGGKTQLLSQFAEHYPVELEGKKIGRYVEPFLGGGAVFLDVAQRFTVLESFLFDINAELILVYKVVQRQAYQLIDLLEQHHNTYYSLTDSERKNYFYEIRSRYNHQRTLINHNEFSDIWVERAAFMIFLNKTCFNGLYRVNSAGEFNVPFGRYKRPLILDRGNLLYVSELLQTAKIQIGSFEDCENFVTGDTFVYFDPPYRPLNETSSFTSYSKDKFNDDDQAKLAKFFAHLDRTSGAKLMLSNSDPHNIDPEDDFFETLYDGYHIQRVLANRMINSKASRRGKISELLITNYT